MFQQNLLIIFIFPLSSIYVVVVTQFFFFIINHGHVSFSNLKFYYWRKYTVSVMSDTSRVDEMKMKQHERRVTTRINHYL